MNAEPPSRTVAGSMPMAYQKLSSPSMRIDERTESGTSERSGVPFSVRSYASGPATRTRPMLASSRRTLRSEGGVRAAAPGQLGAVQRPLGEVVGQAQLRHRQQGRETGDVSYGSP
ncbi:hypothetical protein GCM10020220_036760 [Nonomuraea rubra]|uniref:hypothetical protein n=1 Tax=Nonomuraea rubra TaxID=46180 RepID=UPI0031E570F8